jgi:hypothetical protein
MKLRDAASLLKENGFHFERGATHGEMWVDSYGGRILLSRHLEKSDRRAVKNFSSEVNKLIKRRPVVVSPSLQDSMRKISVTSTLRHSEPLKKKTKWPDCLPKEQVERLRSRIQALSDQKHPASVVTQKVNSEGFKNATGGPVKLSYVAATMSRLRKLNKPEPTKAKPEPTRILPSPSVLPETVLAILTDPALTDRQKVRMIAAYAE